jgi:KDO2-lipid IV(A) lauroyltransferase
MSEAEREQLARRIPRLRPQLPRARRCSGGRRRSESAAWCECRRVERVRALAGRPVILFVPHFVGLDMGWTRLTLELDMVSIYAQQKNFYFNAALYKGRLRFGHSKLLSRQEGVRQAIRGMKAGRPSTTCRTWTTVQRDTIFVPFFNACRRRPSRASRAWRA